MDAQTNIEKPVVDELQLIVDNDLCCACGQSGVGGRKENQDTYGGIGSEDMVILTVCDGMGGMAGGQTASNIAVREILKFLTSIPSDEICIEDVRKSVLQANDAIYQHAVEVPHLRGMGTTATVVVLTKKAAYVAHVGDSRVYLIHKGKKAFRTFDHSKVFEMVQQGMMTEEQARQSSFSNIITRALGIRPSVDVETTTIPFQKGDRFILCCDGIWNTEAEPDMLKLFVSKKPTPDVVKKITTIVNEKGIERGCEHDNLTIIIADMKCRSDFQHSIFQNTFKRILSRAKILRRTDKKK